MSLIKQLFIKVCKVSSCMLLGLGLLLTSAAAQKALTVEELQAHIEEQQAELEAAIENQESTKKELEMQRKALEAQSAKQEELEASMKKLCEEQEAVKPGSMEDCMSSITPK
jgi:predicted Holliday junction resolvase-like endonuclease